MSHSTLDILYDVIGQSLVFDAPEGRPSSVTESVIYPNTTGDSGTTEDAKSGSPAIEATPNTTFDAASGDGQTDPRQCNLTATTGCAIGRRYLATNAIGEREFVEVAGISSGAYVVAREPLANAYTSSDTFASTRISQALSASWTADQSNLSESFSPNPKYRWRLVYVVDSVTYVHDVYFDLVRYAARHDVTGLDVERRFAGWLRSVGTFEREDQGASVIAEAFQHVKFDLYNLNLPDQSIRNREVVNELVKLAAGAIGMNTEAHWNLYNARMQQLVANGKADTAKDSSAAASPGDIVSKFSK
jgi:hypothetical protein